MKSCQYELIVKDLMIAGHPYQEFSSNEKTATIRFDSLRKAYPDNDVELYLMERKLLKVGEKRTLAPKRCPRGHEGKRNGKDVVDVAGMCTVCGEWGV